MLRAVLLKLIVFVTGGVLMALEIVGSRILAPYFGSSIFVWGSLISTVLAALAVGYYWGGVLSKKNPEMFKLGWLILIPAAMILLLPELYPSLNQRIARIDFGVRWNPLLASMVYFLIPGVFLGTISPYAVRLDAKSLSTVGNTAGVLYAISTFGSIVGTLATSFFLIPLMGVEKILYTLGGCLLLAALAAMIAGGRGQPAATTLLVIFVLFLTLGNVNAATLLEKDSLYHRIRVVDENGQRLLFFDRTKQSSMDLKRPYDLKLPYTRHMTLGFALEPNAKRLLFVGLGGGSLPKKYAKDFPQLVMDAVEIDPEVIAIAKRLFFVREAGNFRIYASDGRLYLMKTPHVYDLIFLDAYHADAIPFHMTTREFYRELSKKLSPTGVVATNIIGSVAGPHSRMFRSMIKTLKSVFPFVAIFRVAGVKANPRDLDNIIALATKSPTNLSESQLRQRIAVAQEKGLVDLTPEEASLAFWNHPVKDDDIPLLTDDYAPVDSLLHFRTY